VKATLNFPHDWWIKASPDAGHSRKVISRAFLSFFLIYKELIFPTDALLLLKYNNTSLEKWESPAIKYS